MLLNLSNHPSANWSGEQMQTAILQYGPVEDLPFPQINPKAGASEIEQLAKQFLKLIKEKSETEKLQRAQTDDGVFTGPSKITVHLMGELTFCFALLKLLQAENIRCVASTTERQVLEEVDGRKTAQFRFVQFREYC
jgi:hypothetical protein